MGGGSELEQAAFAAWLRLQPHSEPVGYVALPGLCPLSRWLSALYGVPCQVRTMSYRCEGWETFLPLPEWAVRFAFQIDHRNQVRVGAAVTKAQALWVVARV